MHLNETSVLFLAKKEAVLMSRALISSVMCYLFHPFCCKLLATADCFGKGTILFMTRYSSWQLKDSLLLLCYTCMMEISQKQKEKKVRKLKDFLLPCQCNFFSKMRVQGYGDNGHLMVIS